MFACFIFCSSTYLKVNSGKKRTQEFDAMIFSMDEAGRVVSMALTKTKSLSYSRAMLSSISKENLETISTGQLNVHQ